MLKDNRPSLCLSLSQAPHRPTPTHAESEWAQSPPFLFYLPQGLLYLDEGHTDFPAVYSKAQSILHNVPKSTLHS